MATAAQITACAANAQHSTGPRSPEGKAVSSRNALKLGLYSQSDILSGEDPAEFDQLLHDFEAEYRPAGPIQTAAVHDLVRAIWLVRRCNRIEAQFINLRHADLTPEEQEFPLGAIYARDAEGPNVLQKIERRRAAALRQAARAKEEIARFASAVLLPRKTASPAKQLPSDSVRFDAREMPPISTPIRTPHDNWDNPALRL
jgi:hypothetical protein